MCFNMYNRHTGLLVCVLLNLVLRAGTYEIVLHRFLFSLSLHSARSHRLLSHFNKSMLGDWFFFFFFDRTVLVNGSLSRTLPAFLFLARLYTVRFIIKSGVFFSLSVTVCVRPQFSINMSTLFISENHRYVCFHASLEGNASMKSQFRSHHSFWIKD